MTKQECLASGCQQMMKDPAIQHHVMPADELAQTCPPDTINPCDQGHAYNLSWPPFGYPMADGSQAIQDGCLYQYSSPSGCWNLLGTPTTGTVIPEVSDSKKLRNAFKNEFINSSKSDKEAKLRETIRKIIKNKKK